MKGYPEITLPAIFLSMTALSCMVRDENGFGTDGMRTEDAPIIMDLNLTNYGYHSPEWEYAVEVSFSYTDPNDDVLDGIVECSINEDEAVYQLEVCEPAPVDEDCHDLSQFSPDSIGFTLGKFQKGETYTISVTLIDVEGNESNSLEGEITVGDPEAA